MIPILRRWEAACRQTIKSSMSALTNRNTCSLRTAFMYVGQWSTATGAAAPRGELVPSATVSRPGVTKYVMGNKRAQNEISRY